MNIRDFLALTRAQRFAVVARICFEQQARARRQIIIDDLKRLCGCEIAVLPMKRIN